jgi:hypothetical protein
MLVINKTNRPETLSLPGRRGLKFDPGRTEITDAEYLALMQPADSMLQWFVDKGYFEIQGDVPQPAPEPEKEAEDKAILKAKEKLREAEEAAARKKRAAETNSLRDEINGLLRSGNGKRSMKYDLLAEDYKTDRDGIRDLVKVKDLESSKMFRDWLKAEVA